MLTPRNLHLNERLKAAEKRGMGWALTPFARKAWRQTKEELEQGDSEN